MTPLRKSLSLALAPVLTALLCHQGAQAAAHSSLVVGPLQYTLIDLTPDDGIGPSIHWEPGQFTQSLAASLSDGIAAGGAPNKTEGYSQSGSSADAQSLSYRGFNVSSGPAGLSASAQVDTGGRWNQSATFTQAFVLGANTAVSFTALAQSNLGVTVPEWSVVQTPWGISNGYFDWAPIQAETRAVLHVGSDLQSASSGFPCTAPTCLGVDSLRSSLRSYGTYELPEQKTLQLTITNSTGSTLASQVALGTYIQGYATAPLTMVPEASTGMQMLWGLVLLGGMLCFARRKGAGTPALMPVA